MKDSISVCRGKTSDCVSSPVWLEKRAGERKDGRVGRRDQGKTTRILMLGCKATNITGSGATVTLHAPQLLLGHPVISHSPRHHHVTPNTATAKVYQPVPSTY